MKGGWRFKAITSNSVVYWLFTTLQPMLEFFLREVMTPHIGNRPMRNNYYTARAFFQCI